jgi:hypothetical protein
MAVILHFSMPEYFSGFEVYKIQAMGEGQNVLAPTGDFLIPRTAIFQNSASFRLAFVNLNE